MHPTILVAKFCPVPPRIGRRMGEPFVIERRDILQVGKVAQGKKLLQSLMLVFPGLRRFLVSFGTRKAFPASNVGGDIEPDPIDPGAVEQASRIDKIARGRECHGGNHGLQVRWIFDGRQPLHGTGVRETKSAHISVRPGLLGRPFDGVVAVVALIAISVEFSVGSVPPSDVLQDNCVAASDRF